MLYLITGVPGSGKSLSAVNAINNQVLINRDPKTPPENLRHIYCDIDGIDFGDDVTPVGKDFDWRDAPDGSIIVFDEVHKRWPGTGKPGRSENEDCRDLDEHRHAGKDLYLLTQWPTKLHHEARTNVNEHWHVVRTMGAPMATIYKWNQAQSSPDKRENKDSADSFIFRYPKHLYKHYKSAAGHTHKFKIPAKVKGFALLIVVLMSITVYAGSQLIAEDSALSSTASGKEVATSSSYDPRPKNTNNDDLYKTLLVGCISNDRDCYCYTADGEVLDQEFLECKLMESKPLPTPLQIKSTS